MSVFQNGVSIARSRGSVVQLFDLERVEGLKGPQGTLFATPTYTRRSSVFFEESNMQAFDVVAPITGTRLFSVPAIREGSFGLVNLRVGIELDGGRYIIEGYAENLLDEEYLIDAGNTGGGFGIPTLIPGPPRFYGGAIKVCF